MIAISASVMLLQQLTKHLRLYTNVTVAVSLLVIMVVWRPQRMPNKWMRYLGSWRGERGNLIPML